MVDSLWIWTRAIYTLQYIFVWHDDEAFNSLGQIHWLIINAHALNIIPIYNIYIVTRGTAIKVKFFFRIQYHRLLQIINEL